MAANEKGILPSDGRPTGSRAGMIVALLLLTVVVVPVLPGLYWALSPAITAGGFAALFSDPQWAPAFGLTLFTAVASTLFALMLALIVAISVFDGRGWNRMRRHIPLMLATPHVAFAIGLAMLISPSGWFVRLAGVGQGWVSPPQIITIQDSGGFALIAGLAIKESFFLLWMLIAVLGREQVSRQLVICRSLGYSRLESWKQIIVPSILPRMGWPVAIVLAYGISVVDMAVILGPGNPPTLGVLASRWLSDPDGIVQAKGSAAALVLTLALPILFIVGNLACRFIMAMSRRTFGFRGWTDWFRLPSPGYPLFIAGYFVIIILVVWSFAYNWFFPALAPGAWTIDNWLSVDLSPFGTTLVLAIVTTVLGLVITLSWLEWGPVAYDGMLGMMLVLPVLPVAAGQYAALLRLGMDGTFIALVWSHLFWVTPYMVLALHGQYRAFDNRYLAVSGSFGKNRLAGCLKVKWPMLARQILFSVAVGFAVSVAQYLPTLYAGGGRFVTVTTEAVAISSGGNRQTLAVQAILQMILPLVAFASAAILSSAAARNRKGLA